MCKGVTTNKKNVRTLEDFQSEVILHKPPKHLGVEDLLVFIFVYRKYFLSQRVTLK